MFVCLPSSAWLAGRTFIVKIVFVTIRTANNGTIREDRVERRERGGYKSRSQQRRWGHDTMSNEQKKNFFVRCQIKIKAAKGIFCPLSHQFAGFTSLHVSREFCWREKWVRLRCEGEICQCCQVRVKKFSDFVFLTLTVFLVLFICRCWIG